MNKRGLDSISLIPFIFLLFLAGAGIAIGTSSFYGRTYEFRDIESQALAGIVKTCLEKNDFFAPDFDISKCGLNKDVVEREHLVYVKRSDNKEFFLGVLDYKTQCALSAKNDAYAHCVYFNTTIGTNNLEVIIGSNQHPGRGI